MADEKTAEQKRKEIQASVLMLALPIPGIITTLRHILLKKRKRNRRS